MTPERWPEIKGLFQAALDVEPAQREVFLELRCRDDAELLGEVRRLLEQNDRSTALPGVHEGQAATRAGATELPTAFADGRYRVGSFAGAGGMGRVYRATDTLLNRAVAIKMLGGLALGVGAGGAGADASTRARSAEVASALREARAMAAFVHPGVCRVLDVVTEPGPPVIVMEWIEGVDLASACRTLGREERLTMLLKVVDAAAAMHAAGLVHRDLKPANILVTGRGEPVIVDFGLAVDDAGAAGGAWLRGGTPGYAAPEQFAPPESDSPDIGPAADVYALGVVMYELLTDRAPYTGTTPAEVVERARSEDPPLPEVLVSDCPVALQRICLAAMEREPARRYPTARQLAEDLRRYFRGESVIARPSQLAAQFAEQIEQQLEQTKRWARLGLVTDSEAGDLRRRLTRMLRPDSPWIVDSRRLSHSQVSLYLGGWIAVVAMSVGVLRAWDVLPHDLRLALPPLVALVLIGAGAALHIGGHRRVALVYLITASLAAPLALDLWMRQSGALSGGGAGMGLAELFGGTESRSESVVTVFQSADAASSQAVVHWQGPVPPAQGLFNVQLLAAMISWVAVSVILRRVTHSSAFTLLATVGAVGAWLWIWLVRGGYAPPRDEITVARAGAWALPLAVAAVFAGVRLSSAELVITRRVGHGRARRADSWPILTAGVLLAVAGLSAIAWSHPEWMLLPRLASDSGGPVGRRALAFMCSGSVLLALSWYLSRHPGEARERLAVALRWILPSHFLASLLWLSIENVWGLERTWLIAAGAASIVVCFVSVIKQWKPFVVNGLVYLAAAYFRAFDDAAVRDSRGLQIALAVGAIAIGLGVMAAAWWLPDHLASERVRRVLSRAQSRLSGVRKGTGAER